jgi:hypothetical protein
MKVTWGWAPTPRDEPPAPVEPSDRAAVRRTDRPTDHPALHERTTDHV